MTEAAILFGWIIGTCVLSSFTGILFDRAGQGFLAGPLIVSGSFVVYGVLYGANQFILLGFIVGIPSAIIFTDAFVNDI